MEAPSHVSLGEPSDRAWLWGLAYRMTGVAADADEIVQETYVRALERPPVDVTREWRPWLTRVAMNLARDHLRRRRRRAYLGVWLPSPVPDERFASAEARLGQAETASFALLGAMERLTPNQRAVWLLREVAERDVATTAWMLGMTATNVKVTHHRARLALGGAGGGPSTADRDTAMRVLEAFLWALVTDDVDALRQLVTDDVTATSDGGGEFVAARRPFGGWKKVTNFYRTVGRRDGPPARFRIGWFNGMPGVYAEVDVPRPRWAPRYVLVVEVGADARIRAIRSVVASRKLLGVG